MTKREYNSKLWSDLEWANCYSLYEATQLYESDDVLSFSEFKTKIQSDKNFVRINFLRPGMESTDYNPWSTTHSKKYFLIKRSPDLTTRGIIVKKNTKNKGYSESRINGTPSSCRLVRGDIIYIHETGYGIYGKGIVEKVMKPEMFNNSDEILDFFINKKESVYCYDLLIKLRSAKSKNPASTLCFHQYFVDLQILEKIAPLEGPLSDLKGRQGFSEIKDLSLIQHIENPNIDENLKLNKSIPNALKQRLYSLFNQKYKVSTFIDIDHFVPKSLDGPGNIVENLVPVGFSLNRYKGNSVPLGLFLMAKNYPDLKRFTKGINEKKMFLSSNSDKDKARKIVEIVNKWDDLKKIRMFYKSVMNYHHPNYSKILDL